MIIETSLLDGKKEIKEKIDFSDKIDRKYDILDIEDCIVQGYLNYEHELLETNLFIDVKLVLASTRTLKPIDYHLQFKLDLIFGNSKDADYVLEDKIDLGAIIYGHILLEKPLTIYSDDEKPHEKPREINPAFAALKDL